MASKIINGTTSNENISARMVCSSTPNTEGNYSLVSISGRLSRTNSGYMTSGNGTFYLDINGKTYSATGYYEITQNSDTVMVSVSNIRIDHNADGTKTLTSIKFRGSLPDTSLTSISCSGDFELDDIPRASTITADSSVNAGDSLAVAINRAVSTFTHTVVLTFGSKSLTKTSVETSTTFDIPLDWLTEIPNAASGVATITATTYSGSTKIGTSSKSVTINAPPSAGPTISEAVLTAINQFASMYIKTMSQVKITLTAAALYGATIKSYKIVGGGFSGTTNPYTTPILQQAGTYNFACTVTDSRGLSTTINTASITVQDYSPPSYISVSAQRCNSSGALNINGTYIKALANIAYSSLGGGNSISISVKYRKLGASSYSTDTALTNNTAKVIGAGAILINEMWEVGFTATDTVGNTTPFNLVVARADYVLTAGKDRIGMLVYAQRPGVNLPALDEHMTYFGDTPMTDLFASYDATDALEKLQGVLPVAHGGLGATSFASALGITLIANKSNAVSGACSAGTTETVDISINTLYLVIAWSHVAVGTRTAIAICSNYSNAYVDKILSGGYAPTISMSGSQITISRESYRYNYCVWRIGI